MRAAARVERLASPAKRAAGRAASLQPQPALGSQLPSGAPPSLYVPELERDSCGVGLVAHLHKKPSRKITLDANTMLVRMAHRGGCGCEPNTGDGAGILVGMPHEFLRQRVATELGVHDLPEHGRYAAGNFFFPQDPAGIAESKGIVNRLVEQYGMTVIGWRDLEVDNHMIGPSALATEPSHSQLFVTHDGRYSSQDFERELFRISKLATQEFEANPALQDSYIQSLNGQSLTYKGQLTPEQVLPYFKDLQSDDFSTHMALVHSRFSTNTFPSWDRAQPLNMMCHNGEINTLRGNKNWMVSRESALHSEYFKDSTDDLKPLVSDNMSDSGNFDSVLQLLTKGGGRTLPEAVMLMVPEAWQDNDSLSAAKTSFFQYNSNIMEPWDGPAMVAFTDGRYIGATLDRNGLRPSRYYVTHDDRVLLSSEVGVLVDLPDEMVKTKARLEPGKMFLVDFEAGEVVPDARLKEEMANARDYGKWVGDGQLTLEDWVADAAVPAGKHVPAKADEALTRQLTMFGFTTETMDMLLTPMSAGGKEGLGSMGNDAALAVLSDQPRPVFDYFKQLFAQVTNPPIDPIREEMVMSLMCPVGPESNLLDVTGQHCQRLMVSHPILTLEEMEALKSHSHRGWKTHTIDATYAAGSGDGAKGLTDAIDAVCAEAAQAIENGAQLVILSDRNAGADRYPIPSLLAGGAVHQHLIATKQRGDGAIFLEAGDAKEVHEFAAILGYGVDGVCPYTAYGALSKMNHEGLIEARSGVNFSDAELIDKYRNSAAKGVLKVMSKIGISTLQSYKGAQIFEAVGLADEVIDVCFTGTTSRIQGATFATLHDDVVRRHAVAYHHTGPQAQGARSLIPNTGQYHLRDEQLGGEAHLNTADNMAALQAAVRTNSRDEYERYRALTEEQVRKTQLRGLLKFDLDPKTAVPLDEVEPVSEIVKRFATGAMSLGSISQESHETLAMAMNQIGGRSNTGEGGEDPKRFGDNRRSAIKQVASGRFGVTSHYLANADQIQIKMAQGAKPGEGGELPGHKVSAYIAECRGTTEGVGLISPPPHHDIYSIEDLAQLIHDLKNANRHGDVSVKLVSEVGVGVIAAGVVKAKADHLVISGGDGGTGAAAWTGLKGAGLPFELGIAEAQQTLVLNDLRSRVRLQADGQLKTGRDVIVAALLGAEEWGFSTAPLIALGCIMMRKCHLNTCPVGIATQDPLLRKKFAGEPEHVINYFFLVAEEMREHMAALGYRTVEEMVGQAHRLQVDPERLTNDKTRNLDLSPLLTNAATLNEKHTGVTWNMAQDHEMQDSMDLNDILHQAKPSLDHGEKTVIELDVNNLNRTLGTIVSYEVSVKHGKEGLPDDTITLKLNGRAGQSLGFLLAPGITMDCCGDANDFVGKGLSGGKVIVYPPAETIAAGLVPEESVIVGNACLYGASAGQAYFRGLAGERFCVRNSGAHVVVEGTGDHAAEYMTGGRLVVLGETGRNFGAGMSGGIGYVLDPDDKFPARCNMGMVELDRVEYGSAEADEVKALVQAHADTTGSTVAQRCLDDWGNHLEQFVKVMPLDYKRVLLEQAEAAEHAGGK